MSDTRACPKCGSTKLPIKEYRAGMDMGDKNCPDCGYTGPAKEWYASENQR